MQFQPGKAPYEIIGEHRRCTAMSKQARRRCRQLAAPGSDKCRYHGGWSLRGEDHPGYVHGGATKEARARAVWWNAVARAVMKVNRARTPAENLAAATFTFEVFAREPGWD